jgi:hypothetical protein
MKDEKVAVGQLLKVETLGIDDIVKRTLAIELVVCSIMACWYHCCCCCNCCSFFILPIDHSTTMQMRILHDILLSTIELDEGHYVIAHRQGRASVIILRAEDSSTSHEPTVTDPYRCTSSSASSPISYDLHEAYSKAGDTDNMMVACHLRINGTAMMHDIT